MKNAKLYRKIQKCRRQGVDVALLTIVETRGSTPQKAGAKMAVFPDGKSLGTIGGGCVEAKVKSEAIEMLIEKRGNRVISVDLNDKTGRENGDVCGGTAIISVEYLPALE